MEINFTEDTWARGSFARDKNGDVVECYHKNACRWAPSEFIKLMCYHAEPDSLERAYVMELDYNKSLSHEIKKQGKDTIKEISVHRYSHVIDDWQRTRGITFADVAQMFRDAGIPMVILRG